MTPMQQTIDHMHWANSRTLEALRGVTRPNPRLVELFCHLLAAEHLWHARLVGAPTVYPVWPKLSLDECERLALENHGRLRAYLAGRDAAALEQPVTYTTTTGESFTSTAAEILTHVAMHGSYHRGQIAWQLRADGEVPQPTDYIAFTRGGPAASRRDGGR
ncbi:MAG: DinB family protein [Gemmatimonadales bacterium]